MCACAFGRLALLFMYGTQFVALSWTRIIQSPPITLPFVDTAQNIKATLFISQQKGTKNWRNQKRLT